MPFTAEEVRPWLERGRVKAYLGIDLGGTNTRAALVAGGDIPARTSFATLAGQGPRGLGREAGPSLRGIGRAGRRTGSESGRGPAWALPEPWTGTRVWCYSHPTCPGSMASP